MFSTYPKSPNMVDRTSVKLLILCSSKAFHSDSKRLGPLNPYVMTNPFGDDPIWEGGITLNLLVEIALLYVV